MWISKKRLCVETGKVRAEKKHKRETALSLTFFVSIFIPEIGRDIFFMLQIFFSRCCSAVILIEVTFKHFLSKAETFQWIHYEGICQM